MKKILAIVLSSLVIASLISGCAPDTTISVNVDNNSELSNTTFGKSAMVEIGDGLWYDSTTRIVYWWNGLLYRELYGSTAPSPYYAPNGLPYRYNPQTNSFEEIVKE